MIDLQHRVARLLMGVALAASGLMAGTQAVASEMTPEKKLQAASLAATCANCHGTNGVGVPNAGMPQINHLSSEAMLTQLKAFKSGARTGTIMHQLSKGYTDEQLQTISNILGKK